ncbi:MAG: GNAT family N-acetyltransferase [Woeseiaceae bacterium]|nr:GNAT family N-acetyltransferase [Woeseiaceae bacterium]
MTKTYVVRVSTLDDSAPVSSLLRASYPKLMRSAYDPVLLEKVLPRMTTAQPGLLESDSYYVAESAEGRIIGCGGWTRERPGTTEIEESVGHVRHFGVHPEWTRCGVGKALYARCARDAREAGVAKFECYSSLNGEAFYAALGFRRLGLIDLHMFDDAHFPTVHMTADI